MKYKRLYIIGNGFDLHYGIKSSYKDYLEYLEGVDSGLFDLLLTLFPASLWKDFESSLGDLAPGSLNEDCFCLIVHDDESDFAWERESASWNYHYAAMKKELDVARIESSFREWVAQIDISRVKPDSVISDSEGTLYLTFNYTRTLEDCFGIDPHRILHIHGEVGDDRLIFGHAPIVDKKIMRPQQYYEQDMLEDLRSLFIDRTEKPVVPMLLQNYTWFESLRNVEEVVVSGFSFSPVDLPYIRRVKSCVKPDSEWKVFVRNDATLINIPVVGSAEALRYPCSPFFMSRIFYSR